MSALIDKILGRLDLPKQRGKNWVARCPAHSDRSPSLSITERDGKVLLHCFAGCTTEEILDSLNLEWSDLFEESLTENDRLAYRIRGLSQQIQQLEDTLYFYAQDMRRVGLNAEEKHQYAVTIQKKLELERELRSIRP